MKIRQIELLSIMFCFISSCMLGHDRGNLALLSTYDDSHIVLSHLEEHGAEGERGGDGEARIEDLPEEQSSHGFSQDNDVDNGDVPQNAPQSEEESNFDEMHSQVIETKKDNATVSFMTGAFVVISALLFFAGMAATKTAEGKRPISG